MARWDRSAAALPGDELGQAVAVVSVIQELATAGRFFRGREDVLKIPLPAGLVVAAALTPVVGGGAVSCNTCRVNDQFLIKR
jgi:hypothetical protein